MHQYFATGRRGIGESCQQKGVAGDGVLYGINQSIHHTDITVVVIPGAFGCLLTGLIYSVGSNWDFCKHNWMIFKWVVTVAAIMFGTFFLGPWKTRMMEISGNIGMAALNDSGYEYNETMNMVFGACQVIVLMITIWGSVFKPWKSRKSAEARR